jgi:hypothetical protein
MLTIEYPRSCAARDRHDPGRHEVAAAESIRRQLLVIASASTSVSCARMRVSARVVRLNCESLASPSEKSNRD